MVTLLSSATSWQGDAKGAELHWGLSCKSSALMRKELFQFMDNCPYEWFFKAGHRSNAFGFFADVLIEAAR
ncbi:MAG: hypothetical protein JWM16_255 [Verrucomicrobiales bacterium]|nr:hypothetical protein [Verrucomicrobiales bacterium]